MNIPNERWTLKHYSFYLQSMDHTSSRLKRDCSRFSHCAPLSQQTFNGTLFVAFYEQVPFLPLFHLTKQKSRRCIVHLIVKRKFSKTIKKIYHLGLLSPKRMKHKINYCPVFFYFLDIVTLVYTLRI